MVACRALKRLQTDTTEGPHLAKNIGNQGVRMKFSSVAMFVSTLALFSSSSEAITDIGSRTITQMGCHTVDPTCFMTLSGAAFGPAGCTSTQLRWNADQMPNAKIFVMQMTAAFVAGQRVTIVVSDNCYASWPTPHYYYVDP
jgi:hypothetical protein